MTAILLEQVGNCVFKATKFLEEADVKPKELLNEPKKFLLATRMCDGTYHRVSSELPSLITENKEALKRGNFADLINSLSPDETLHGQRFVIFQDGKSKAYLLGDVVSALGKFK